VVINVPSRRDRRRRECRRAREGEPERETSTHPGGWRLGCARRRERPHRSLEWWRAGRSVAP